MNMATKTLAKQGAHTRKSKVRQGPNVTRRKMQPGEAARIHQNIYAAEFSLQEKELAENVTKPGRG
jgi:hypothetical protein